MFGSNVVIGPSTELGKELAKWNKPYRYEQWPKMLYKARRRPDGVIRSSETEDRFFNDRPNSAEQWTTSNQKIVQNEDDYLKAKGQGWCDSQVEAVEAFKASENEVATQAAHRAHDDRLMGEQAREEIKAAEGDSSFEHVAEVKEKPKRKYTRRKPVEGRTNG